MVELLCRVVNERSRNVLMCSFREPRFASRLRRANNIFGLAVLGNELGALAVHGCQNRFSWGVDKGHAGQVNTDNWLPLSGHGAAPALLKLAQPRAR